jgi:NADH pyrophosphatase NudC (nudix superfamily)
MTKDKQQAQVFLEAAARLEAAKENNFCPRCGTKLVGIELHTCTPPEARK